MAEPISFMTACCIIIAICVIGIIWSIVNYSAVKAVNPEDKASGSGIK